jgi:hypothetical protein
VQDNVTGFKSYLTELIGWNGSLLVSFHDLTEAGVALDAINRAGTHLATFWTRAEVEKVIQLAAQQTKTPKIWAEFSSSPRLPGA